MATATALSLSGDGGGGGGRGSLLRSRYPATVARCCAVPRSRRRPAPRRLAASRADDSSQAPFEMTLEGALKLLGVAEGASFDDILRAKNAVLASCKDDQDAVAQVEAAYDMLLMQSLSQRRAGKVVDNSIRYADVKPVKSAGSGMVPQWMQATMKNAPVTFEAPSSSSLGFQSCVYGALMVFTYASGSSTSLPSTYTSPDVPGFILATGFGASLYFLTKKNMNLGVKQDAWNERCSSLEIFFKADKEIRGSTNHMLRLALGPVPFLFLLAVTMIKQRSLAS